MREVAGGHRPRPAPYNARHGPALAQRGPILYKESAKPRRAVLPNWISSRPNWKFVRPN